MIAITTSLGQQVSLKRACAVLSVPRSTLYRASQPRPEPKPRPTPANALSEAERAEVREVLNSQRFMDKAPRQVYASLLNIRYYMFLNEQILPLGDGSFTHWDMQLSAGQINILSVNIPTLADGIYDLVVAGIPNFDIPPIGIAGYSERGNIATFTRRVSLVVGDGQPTDLAQYSQILPALTFFTEARMAELSRMGLPLYTLIPTLTEEPYWWVWPDLSHKVTVGSEYTFNLLTHYQNYRIQDERYDNGARMRFALIGFQNNTLLNLGDTSSTLYREITNVTERAAIPITLVAPENPGRYDLVFFKIDYPGVPLCRLTTRLFPGVEGIRMSIEAVPQAD